MQIVGSRQASNHFGSLINTVQNGNTVKITRNNTEVAIIISPADFELLGGEEKILQMRYEDMEKKRNKLGETLKELRAEAQKNGLTQEILDDIINE